MTANRSAGTIRRAGCVAAAMTLGVPTVGLAQEAVGTTGIDRPTVIEEIVITARKRTERAQEVPMSVSVLTGERLERAVDDGFRDIGGAFPGVSYNDSNGRNSEFSIRGLTSAGSGSDTSIGLYIDEVFVGNEAAVSQRLFDLQNVQVLRGPQGTLFGRNTVAGAINIVTQKPEAELGGSVNVSAGNYDLRQYGVTLNLPILDDRLMTRLNYVSRERDGFLANSANPGEYGNDEDGESVRLHVLARPTDDLEILLSMDGSRDRTCENMFTLVDGALHDGSDDPDVSAWDEPCGTKADVKGASLRVDRMFDAVTFTSISAYRERDEYFLTDRDFTALPILATGLDASYRHFTQEFRVSGGEGERLNWVAGAFFFDREHFQNTLLQLGPGFLGPGLTNLVQSVAKTDTESYAAFASGEYALTDRLKAEIGLRYTWESKSVDYVQTATLPIPGFGEVAPFNREVDGGEWSPTVSLAYEFSDDSIVYGRISRGFKSGGFNAGPSSNPDQVEFQPETLMSYETGVKAWLVDGVVQFDGNLFYMDYEDIQQSDQDGAGFFISNAASARSYGAETQASVYFSENVVLHGGLGYVNAKYEEFGAKSGNYLPRAPEWTGSLSLDMSWDAGAGSVYFIPQVLYRSDNYVDSANTEAFKQESHTLLNAALGYESAGGWSVVAWGRNLGDERFTLGGFAVAPIVYAVTPSPPRTYGLDFRWNF